jgi:hypothetical protein
MPQGTSDGYYEAVIRSRDNPRRKPISAGDAHRSWTEAVRTSENSYSTHSGE